MFSSLVMKNFGSYKLIDFSPEADGPHLALALNKESLFATLFLRINTFNRKLESREGLKFVKHLEKTMVGLGPSEVRDGGVWQKKREIISQMGHPCSIEDENIMELTFVIAISVILEFRSFNPKFMSHIAPWFPREAL